MYVLRQVCPELIEGLSTNGPPPQILVRFVHPEKEWGRERMGSGMIVSVVAWGRVMRCGWNGVD